MKTHMKKHFKQAIAGLAAFCMLAQPLAASAAVLNFAQTPMFVSAPIPPMVMLDISKDQQLFKKAYTDFSDLDGDGVLDLTYNHGIDYYGYFDPYKCYTYNASNKRYEPAAYAGQDTSTASSSATNLAAKYCSAAGVQATTWSGNFLNWATMTRMDAVRKLLYGGLRSPSRSNGDGGTINDGDLASGTVLERTFLPNDAHSFAKYYSGADLARLTPFTQNLFSTTSTSTVTISTGTNIAFTVASTANFADNDIVQVESTASPGNYMRGVLTGTTSTGIKLANVTLINLNGSGPFSSWKVTNLSRSGMTICNTTLGSSTAPQNRSQTNTNLPRMRVAKGNYSLWSANERWQCLWSNEQSVSPIANQFDKSNLPAISGSPDRTSVGLDNKSNSGGQGDYFVRIQACVSSLLGTEKCKKYNQTNVYKPIGLLQVYGESAQIYFGLMTGSYNKNISGGVLRKNVSAFTDEIAADGTFISLPSAGVAVSGTTMSSGAASPGGGSIITTLNLLRIWGYNYGDGTYIGGGTIDDCTFQQTSITEGKCVSWGNPMSEVYYESLRYFAGQTTPTTAFNTDDTTKIAGLATANWPSTANKVLAQANYCAPSNILVFNASVSTNETDNQIGNPFQGLTFNAVTQTTTVGNSEGINGTNKFFIGRTSATGTSTTTDNEYCDAKVQTGLGNMYGICPEGPTLAGSFLMAGLAHTAHTNKIRNDLTVPSTDLNSLRVNTYGISLATNVPQINLTLAGQTAPKVVIQPAYRLNNTAPQGGGSLVDMQVVSQVITATSVKGGVALNWEDSEQGGDYDQDFFGTLFYCMQTGGDTTSCPGQAANTLSVTTTRLGDSTAAAQGFGYITSGTTKDGPHFHTGIFGFNYTDPTNISVTPTISPNPPPAAGTYTFINASGGCSNCLNNNPSTTATYLLSSSGSTASSLKDPLYYAAKYGGFKDANNDGLPNAASEWDVVVNSSGNSGADGIPDNYFQVSNPLGLETSLNKLFISILATSSGSAAAVNSAKLSTSSTTYQALFNSQDWSGQLLAISLDAQGKLVSPPNWDAGIKSPTLNSGTSTANQNGRVVLTYNKGVSGGAVPHGIPMRWPASPASPGTSELSPAQITALRTNPSSGLQDADPIGQNRLLYVRGDRSNETAGGAGFRNRANTVLGDIADSNIVFVGPPSAGLPDPSYATFASTYKTRKPVIYVGANDGMVHGVDASLPSTTTNSGTEVLAFVPSKMFPKLSKLTSQTYVNNHTFFVDGSPVQQDAFTNGAWKSVLVGGYNAGGKGLYALNVTDPTQFTEANASSLVMWEFTNDDDADLGYTYGTPMIAQMANGKWAAIVSNGYNNSDASASGETACTGGTGTTSAPFTPTGCNASLTGQAYLFVIFLDGPDPTTGKWRQGTDYIKIATGAGSAGTPNGLSTPATLDLDGNGLVDFVYAGDLLGNLWKFDLSATTIASWTGSTKIVNLFTALDSGSPAKAQPITSSPIVALHPSGVGFIVSFGTGKYLEPTDINPPGPAYRTQTLYGIWDRNNPSTVGAINTQTSYSSNAGYRTDHSLMQQQVLLYLLPGNPVGNTITGRITSAFQPNYSASSIAITPTPVSTDPLRTSNYSPVPPQNGWFLDLSNDGTTFVAGERNTADPGLQNGTLIYATLWPLATACLGATAGGNLDLNMSTGANQPFPTFDANGDGFINSSDLVAVPGLPAGVAGLAVNSIVNTGGSSQVPTFVHTSSSSPSGTPGSPPAPGTATAALGYGRPGGYAGPSQGLSSTTSGAMIQRLFYFGQDGGRMSWREIISD